MRFQDLKMRPCFLSLTAIEPIISTIYPKSRFCTKRHKRLDFQGFSAVSRPFAQKAEKENCKFEHQKYKSVPEVRLGTFHTHKPLLRRMLLL